MGWSPDALRHKAARMAAGYAGMCVRCMGVRGSPSPTVYIGRDPIRGRECHVLAAVSAGTLVATGVIERVVEPAAWPALEAAGRFGFPAAAGHVAVLAPPDASHFLGLANCPDGDEAATCAFRARRGLKAGDTVSLWTTVALERWDALLVRYNSTRLARALRAHTKSATAHFLAGIRQRAARTALRACKVCNRHLRTQMGRHEAVCARNNAARAAAEAAGRGGR